MAPFSRKNTQGQFSLHLMTPSMHLQRNNMPHLRLVGVLAPFHELGRLQIWLDSAHLLPSGEHTKSNGNSPFLMGKSTISMAIFHCFLYVHQRVISTGPNTPNMGSKAPDARRRVRQNEVQEPNKNNRRL